MIRNYAKPVPKPKGIKTVRDRLREHLNHARMSQAQLGEIWGIRPESARRLLHRREDRNTQLTPKMIDAVVTALKLDAFDARELHWYAALEWGFKLGRLPPIEIAP